MLGVWSMLSNAIPTFKGNGGPDGDAFKLWCRQTFQQHNPHDIVEAANVVTTTWKDNFAPSLPTFLSFVRNAKQAREIDEQLKSRSDPGRGLEQAPGKTKEQKKEFMKKFRELSKQISKSSTSREPSPGDVESFAESYRRLGLVQRYGPLPSAE